MTVDFSHGLWFLVCVLLQLNAYACLPSCFLMAPLRCLLMPGFRMAVAPSATRLGAVTRGESSLNMAVKKTSKKVR